MPGLGEEEEEDRMFMISSVSGLVEGEEEEEEMCGSRGYHMVLFPTRTSYDQATQMCAEFNSKTGTAAVTDTPTIM